jgi:hypothetical protein
MEMIQRETEAKATLEEKLPLRMPKAVRGERI